MAPGKPQVGNAAFIALWLMVVAALTYLLLSFDTNPRKFFAANLVPVGMVGSVKGSLQRRHEDLTKWDELDVGDEIDDSDKLATGQGARASIRLAGDRELILGELTQIMIKSVLMSSDRAYDIEVLRGTVVASQPKSCAGCAPIIIKAGKESLEVDSGREIGYFRDVGQFGQQFDPKGAWPSLSRPNVGQTVVERQAQPIVQPTATVAPVQATPKPDATGSLRGLEPNLSISPLFEALVTLESPGGIAGSSLTVNLAAPSTRPSEPWTPYVEILDASGRPTGARIAGIGRAMAQQVNVPVATILRAVPPASGMVRYMLRSGATVGTVGSERLVVGNRTTLMSIAFVSAGSAPTLLGLDSLTAASTRTPWLDGRSVVEPRNTPVQVLLRSGTDYARFLPYLRSSSRLGMAARPFDLGSGTFAVRGGAIVAKLASDGAIRAASQISRILQASLVFSGPGSAFVELSSNPNANVATLRRLVETGQSVYLYDGDNIVPVSSTFIQTSTDLASFLATAKAIFTQRVQILP